MISLYAIPCGPGGLTQADLVLPFKAQSVFMGSYGCEGLPTEADEVGLELLWEMQTGDDRPKEKPIGFWVLMEEDLNRIMKEHVSSVPFEDMDDEEKAKAVVLKVRAAASKAAILTTGSAPQASA